MRHINKATINQIADLPFKIDFTCNFVLKSNDRKRMDYYDFSFSYNRKAYRLIGWIGWEHNDKCNAALYEMHYNKKYLKYGLDHRTNVVTLHDIAKQSWIAQ